MARSKSVILSAAEKKSLMGDLKAKIKAAKQVSKDAAAARKAAEKSFAGVQKAYTAVVKGFDKTDTANSKALSALEGQLAALAT